EDLKPAEADALFRAVVRLAGPVRAALGAAGTTIGVNNGEATGQTIPHVHVHIVPRWPNDGAGSVHTIFPRHVKRKRPAVGPALRAEHARAIRRTAGAPTLVELGSGSSGKTRHLLRAWPGGRYVAVDISLGMLRQSCAALAAELPGLEVRGIAASYERAFPLLRDLSPVVLIFLGTTIGNLNPQETADFLDRGSAARSPGALFLGGS